MHVIFLIYMVIAILCNCPENRTGMNGVKSHHTCMTCPGSLKDINALLNYMQSTCPGDLKDVNIITSLYLKKCPGDRKDKNVLYVIIAI